MKTSVYFFSGTGNSFFVAKEIAVLLKANVINIASVMNLPKLQIQDDNIGVIFPVYYGRIPLIVKEFIHKLSDLTDKYLFAISTFGSGAGNCKEMINNILLTKNSALTAFFGLHLIHNIYNRPWEDQTIINEKSKEQIKKIAKRISCRKPGMFLSSYLQHALMSPLHNLMLPLYKKKLALCANTSLKLGFDELQKKVDNCFAVSENCNGCGICEKICPVNNIQLTARKPIWNNHCENCLACYNWCPNKAITTSLVQDSYYYTNENVRLVDLLIKK